MLEIATHFPPPLKFSAIWDHREEQWGNERAPSSDEQDERGADDEDAKRREKDHPSSKKSSSQHQVDYESFSGVSFSALQELLRPTHDFLFFPDLGDSLFAHKKLRPHLERYFGITLPVDEFLCFAGSHLWYMYPTEVVRDWALLLDGKIPDVHAALHWAWVNVTRSLEGALEGGGSSGEAGGHKFMLWV